MRDTPKSALWLSWILRLCRPAPAPDRGDTQVARYAIGEPQQIVAIPATGGALMRRQSAQFAAAPPGTP